MSRLKSAIEKYRPEVQGGITTEGLIQSLRHTEKLDSMESAFIISELLNISKGKAMSVIGKSPTWSDLRQNKGRP